ncbi:MAG: alpha/beta hydrolase [Rhodococcus sp. (in: high G+C Gram-positive bacteria)]
MTTWAPDVLGDDYEQLTIPLGSDPDGEGDIRATLVRSTRSVTGSAPPKRAVLYVHGYTDYFFQRHVAQHFADLGYAFYALDLRKCGRSIERGQTPHFVSDLELYDAELDRALSIVREETGVDVLMAAHSTGGLIVPLWLDRLEHAGGVVAAGITGVVLNSPWFDLQGPPLIRSIGTVAIGVLGRFAPTRSVPGDGLDTYGLSISSGGNGDWDYDLDWKPLAGFPIKLGWIRAVRRGHAKLHRGLDIGVPSLILRSKATRFSKTYIPDVDTADAVLDVRQIARWAGCLGNRTTIVPIEGARHDVFLSTDAPLERAFAEMDVWLAERDEGVLDAAPSGGDHAEMATGS